MEPLVLAEATDVCLAAKASAVACVIESNAPWAGQRRGWPGRDARTADARSCRHRQRVGGSNCGLPAYFDYPLGLWLDEQPT